MQLIQIFLNIFECNLRWKNASNIFGFCDGKDKNGTGHISFLFPIMVKFLLRKKHCSQLIFT